VDVVYLTVAANQWFEQCKRGEIIIDVATICFSSNNKCD
jgi:hypothetical protein